MSWLAEHTIRDGSAVAEALDGRQMGPKPVPEILAGLYRSSLEAPEAFQAEYEASTNRVLSILQSFQFQEVDLQLDDRNALHYAAGCGCLEVCEALLRHPQLNFQEDRHGHTPLLWAVRHGMAGAMQLLLRHGAVPWHSDHRGLTALHWACALGFGRLCKLLLMVPLNAEAMKDQRCQRGWTPLHSAAYSGSAACCEHLLDAGADETLRTPRDWTALHLAALQGQVEALKVLASHCSTEVFLALDAQGLSALDLAKESGHLEAAEVLRHPEETHRHLVRAWYKCLSRGPKVAFDDLIEAALLIKAPEVEKVGQDALELCCQVVDLGFRIAGYVVEVKDCRGPSGAAPARVYYARTKEQRKVDEVEFLVPRLRQTSGQAIWQRGGTYQFRLRGCCDRRSAPDPYSLRQVVSDWSVALSLTGRSSRPSKPLGASERTQT